MHGNLPGRPCARLAYYLDRKASRQGILGPTPEAGSHVRQTDRVLSMMSCTLCLRNLLRGATFSLSVSLIQADPVLIFDSGPPNVLDIGGSTAIDFIVTAENFELGADASITGVKFWAVENQGFFSNGVIDWYMFADDGTSQPNPCRSCLVGAKTSQERISVQPQY